jgi:hypothetical protein
MMDSRDNFEKWYLIIIDASELFIRCGDNLEFYDDTHVQIAWRGYQAALAHAQQGESVYFVRQKVMPTGDWLEVSKQTAESMVERGAFDMRILYSYMQPAQENHGTLYVTTDDKKYMEISAPKQKYGRIGADSKSGVVLCSDTSNTAFSITLPSVYKQDK